MSVISPRLASLLALNVYNIQKPAGLGKYRFVDVGAEEITKHFDFDLSNGPIKGVSGGILSHLFKSSTGSMVLLLVLLHFMFGIIFGRNVSAD